MTDVCWLLVGVRRLFSYVKNVRVLNVFIYSYSLIVCRLLHVCARLCVGLVCTHLCVCSSLCETERQSLARGARGIRLDCVSEGGGGYLAH